MSPALMGIDDENLASQWEIEPGVTYLNHGSFGLSPMVVRQTQQAWRDRLERQPMRFFIHALEPALRAARERLAEFVGVSADSLIFVENATEGMNVVAHSVPLNEGEEVLLTNQVYGAVRRIWERACQRQGAQLVTAEVPWPLSSHEQIVDALFAQVTPRTRLIVVSHIVSATALIMPVAQIIERAKREGILVCVDGPHAPAQLALNLNELQPHFYTASNHKWLSAPFGSGFLMVDESCQQWIEPPNLSWGRLRPQPIESWSDEFIWPGTRDPSAYLTTTAAIDFLEAYGVEKFRSRCHALAQFARRELTEFVGLEPPYPDSPDWYGCMALIPLPPLEKYTLGPRLRDEFGIEVLLDEVDGQSLLRVSCHLYNSERDILRLRDALQKVLF